MATSFEYKLVLLIKWLAVVLAFFVVIMPAQIIWLLLYPVAKILKKKQEAKTDVYIPLNPWAVIDWYGKFAKKVLNGEY